MSRVYTKDEKKHNLMRARIVSRDTACASLPLELSIGHNSYGQQLRREFFDSAWPLDTASQPLICTFSQQTNQYSYASALTPKTPLFHIPSDSTATTFQSKPMIFNTTIHINKMAYHVIQEILPPLQQVEDAFTPHLAGGQIFNQTAANPQPLFSFNASLNMLQVSPPVFRAIAVHSVFEKNAKYPSSPFLFASFLVRIPATSTSNAYYCLLQILDIQEDALPVSRLAQQERFMEDGMEQLLGEYALYAPYLVPNPLSLDDLFVSSTTGKLCNMNALSFGIMGVSLASICQNSSSSSTTTLKSSSRLHTTIAQDVSLLPSTRAKILFSLPWKGKSILPSLYDPRAMDAFVRWGVAEKKFIKQSAANFIPLLFYLAPRSPFRDLLDARVAKIQGQRYEMVFSRALLQLPAPANALLQESKETPQQLAPCKFAGTCRLFISSSAYDDLGDFHRARNKLLLPHARRDSSSFIDLSPCFACLPRPCEMVFKDGVAKTLYHSMPSFYSMLSYKFCMLRIRADSLHYYFRNSDARDLEETLSSPFDPSVLSLDYQISKTDAWAVFHHLLVLEFLNEFLALAFSCLSTMLDLHGLYVDLIKECIFDTVLPLCHATCRAILVMLQRLDETNHIMQNLNNRTGVYSYFPETINSELEEFAIKLDTMSEPLQGVDFSKVAFSKTSCASRDKIAARVYALLLTFSWMAKEQDTLTTRSKQEELQQYKRFEELIKQDGISSTESLQVEVLERWCCKTTTTTLKKWRRQTLFERQIFFAERDMLKKTWEKHMAPLFSGYTGFMKTNSNGHTTLVFETLIAVTRPTSLFLPVVKTERLWQPGRVALANQPTEISTRASSSSSSTTMTRTTTTTTTTAAARNVGDGHKLKFEDAAQIGKGGYGTVFRGRLVDPVSQTSLPLTWKVEDANNLLQAWISARIENPKTPEQRIFWRDKMKAFEIRQELVEIVVAVMLQSYGWWEEDPYIVSPLFFWAGLGIPETNFRDEFLHILMEEFPDKQFLPLGHWVRENKNADTEREILFQRLNRYYDYMAYDSPIHLIMNDNHLGNVLVENAPLVHARMRLLVILDQSMSTVSVPLVDLDYKDGDKIAPFVHQDSVTFYNDLYERSGRLRRQNTIHGRQWTAGMPLAMPATPHRWEEGGKK